MKTVRGMKDLIGQDFIIHDYIRSKSEEIGLLYGFAGVSTPVIERTEIFTRTLGDTSDIVSKEMYTFLDRGGDSLTLRPEFTAGIVRSFISNNLNHSLPLKLFSCGPVFRYDRPQAGRYRQFHQINFEHLGDNDPYSDAEIIRIAADILEKLGILKNTELQINSLGSDNSRLSYMAALKVYFQKYENDISDLSKVRLHKNPMRIFDSKDVKDQNICKDAPLIKDYYDTNDNKYFYDVLNYLEMLGVSYKVNYKIVRGLDYYTHTAFEYVTDKLGAQSTVLAGGRYDGLCQAMGGKHLPAIGFAAGIERLALLMENNTLASPRTNVLLSIGNDVLSYCFVVAELLRKSLIPVVLLKNGKIGKRFEEANKLNAKYTIVIGEEEERVNKMKIKDMDTGIEEVMDIHNAILLMKSKL